MRLSLTLLFLIFSCVTTFGQETFPLNGVKENFQPIFAFTNAHIIISPEKEIKKGILIIQGNKIMTVDSNVTIPKGAIIKDLDGDYLYPSFIDLYTDYGLKKLKKESITIARNTKAIKKYVIKK